MMDARGLVDRPSVCLAVVELTMRISTPWFVWDGCRNMRHGIRQENEKRSTARQEAALIPEDITTVCADSPSDMCKSTHNT